MKVVKINRARLTNGQHFSFMRSFIELLNRVNPSGSKCQAAIGSLRSAFEQEDKSMKIARGSVLTKQIQEQDSLRDKTYGGLKRIITVWSEMGIEASTTSAADELLRLVKTYNIDPKAQIDEETGLMDNFIDDVRGSSSMSAGIDKLGLRLLFETMSSANTAVRQLLSERNVEGVDKVAGALKSARVESDAAYDKMTELLESLLVTADDASPFEAIIVEWNGVVERYKLMLAHKSTKDTPEEEGV